MGLQNKRWRVHGHPKKTYDPDRDADWLGTIEAINQREAGMIARKMIRGKKFNGWAWVVDGIERVYEPPFKHPWESSFAPLGPLRLSLSLRVRKDNLYLPEYCEPCGDREMALEGEAEAEYERQMADENRRETEFEPALTEGM